MDYSTTGIPYTPGDPLPIQPGGIVYFISTSHFYEIREQKIDGVAVFADRCCVILDGDLFPVVDENYECKFMEIDLAFFRTREDAEKWKKRHLVNPPFPLDECFSWVSPEQFIPSAERNTDVYVKLQTPEGIVKTEAYYDDGSKHPEDKGFWDGLGRHSKKLDNVIAWIQDKHWDEEDRQN